MWILKVQGDPEGAPRGPRNAGVLRSLPISVRWYGFGDTWRFRCAAFIVAAFVSSACFQMSAVIKVSADGSGTIEHQFVEAKAEIARLHRPQEIDPASESRARSEGHSLGPGVTYRSSTPIDSSEWHGRATIYTFADVSRLQFSQGEDIFGASPGGDSPVVTAFTCSVTQLPNGHAVLHVKLTKPDWFLARDPDKPGGGLVPFGETMLQQTLDGRAARAPGGRVSIVIQPNGRLVRTNSSFVDGNRVTLQEVDVDRALDDQSFIARLRAAQTVDDYWSAIRNVPGRSDSRARDHDRV